MKNILLILLLSIPICYAQPQENLAISSSYDSLETVVDNLYKSQKEIKNSIDSLNKKFPSDKFITVEMLEKSQEFYTSSFNKIQNSYTIFIAIIAGIITFLAAFLVYANIKYSSEIKKEFEAQLQNQQKLFNDEFEKQKKENEVGIESLRKQLVRSYFEAAVYAYDIYDIKDAKYVKYMKYIKSHLIQLNSYFITIANLKLELNIDDFFFLEKIGSYIQGYKYIPESFVQFFSAGLKKFIDYCKTSEKRNFIKKEDEQIFIEKAEKIWPMFFEKFDKGDINNLIEDYNKMSLNDRISMKHNAMRNSSDENEKVRWANDYEE